MYVSLKYLKNLINIFCLLFSIRIAEERTNQLSAFAFRQNAQVTMEIILYDIVSNVTVSVIIIVVAVITFITRRFRTSRSWIRKHKLIWFKRLSGKLSVIIAASLAQLDTTFLFCSLLREAEPISIDSNRDTTEIGANTSNKGGIGFAGSSSGSGAGGIGSTFGHCDPTSLEERQLLGRYGVWLLVGLCTPNEDTPVEILGRLLSMLFHWFHVTAYCFDGIEKRLIHLIFSVGNLTLCIYTLYSSRRRKPDVGRVVWYVG